MYTTKMHIAEIGVEEYIKEYVNVEEFLEYCKECPNYDEIWSCPSFDFDPVEYWKAYRTLELYAVEIFLDEKDAGRLAAPEELQYFGHGMLREEKKRLTDLLYEKEKEYPGSISLSAGTCLLCEECSRKDGMPCRHPEKIRYSIEAIGGDVGRTISRLMGIELEWVTEGRLPSKYVLVCGLLKK